jgi:micrococcal nuclease
LEVLLLLLIVSVFVWAAVFGKRRSSRGRTPPHKAEPYQSDRAKVAPFDATTAKPRPDHPVIEGPAYVVDGDTLIIQKSQIRLFGVDAPEMNHPYGKKAKWALVSLCKGQIVRAEITDQDDHGRNVARCFLSDGRDLSAEMVKLGLAIDWPKFSGGAYRSLEVYGARKKLWLADARQKGRMHVWESFEARERSRPSK